MTGNSPKSPVLARHLALGMGKDGAMDLKAVIVVTDMANEGEVLEFEEKHTGGTREIVVGPKTYYEMFTEGDKGGSA
jgi:hypothetical protein